MPWPPEYVLASVIGFLERKSTIAIARQLCGKERNFKGNIFGLGHAVSPVGFELEQDCQYIRDQEEADGTGEQL